MPSQEFSKALCFSYGEGVYRREGQQYKGEIVLSAHKLYLKDGNGEISPTFVPLEKIYRIKFFFGKLILYVRPSNFMQFTAQLNGSVKNICALKRDLIDQRQLKKKFFGFEWVDPEENIS